MSAPESAKPVDLPAEFPESYRTHWYSVADMKAYATAAVLADRASQRQPERDDDLKQAAQAVVDRWDTPLWKDAPHTGEYINRLRAALASPQDRTVEP